MLSDVAIDLAGVVAGGLFAMIVLSVVRGISRRHEKDRSTACVAGTSGDTKQTDLSPDDRERDSKE